MNRSGYVSLVLIPLLIALGLLLFAIGTEYWTQLDYTRIKRFDSNQSQFENSRNYEIKKVRFEFPKYTSLFGECDEYKLVDILVPLKINYQSQTKTNNSNQNLDLNLSPKNEFLISENQTQAEETSSSPEKFIDYDSNGCMSRQICTELNKKEPNSCFCCGKQLSKYEVNDRCCFLKSKRCDGVSNCKDKSDELENCPMRKLFYSNRYYDNKHNCLRHQYNLISFAKHAIDSFIKKNDSFNESDFCLKKLLRSSSYSVKIFVLRVVTLVSLIACVLFTILCIISIVFVSCCNNLNGKRKTSFNPSNEFSYVLASDEDYSTENLSSKSKCCKCNCLLCPFVFYSFFSFFALLFCLIGLCVYLFSLCYVRNAFLIYDSEFIPEHISRAYQYNSWLFDIQRFGISFYAFVLSFLFYLLVFIMSTCVSCRIQMSPAWRRRYTDSYEVLQMHDIVLNKRGNAKSYGKSSFYKKINKENKNSEKEAKKISKKYKKRRLAKIHIRLVENHKF